MSLLKMIITTLSNKEGTELEGQLYLLQTRVEVIQILALMLGKTVDDSRERQLLKVKAIFQLVNNLLLLKKGIQVDQVGNLDLQEQEVA